MGFEEEDGDEATQGRRSGDEAVRRGVKDRLRCRSRSERGGSGGGLGGATLEELQGEGGGAWARCAS